MKISRYTKSLLTMLVFAVTTGGLLLANDRGEDVLEKQANYQEALLNTKATFERNIQRKQFVPELQKRYSNTLRKWAIGYIESNIENIDQFPVLFNARVMYSEIHKAIVLNVELIDPIGSDLTLNIYRIDGKLLKTVGNVSSIHVADAYRVAILPLEPVPSDSSADPLNEALQEIDPISIASVGIAGRPDECIRVVNYMFPRSFRVFDPLFDPETPENVRINACEKCAAHDP